MSCKSCRIVCIIAIYAAFHGIRAAVVSCVRLRAAREKAAAIFADFRLFSFLLRFYYFNIFPFLIM